MRALRLSPKARSNLDAIWDYTALGWGTDQAEAYLRDINHAFTVLQQSPEIAAPCDHIRPGLRRLPSGSHVIFLRLTRDELVIVRVLHGRMDAGLHL